MSVLRKDDYEATTDKCLEFVESLQCIKKSSLLERGHHFPAAFMITVIKLPPHELKMYFW